MIKNNKVFELLKSFIINAVRTFTRLIKAVVIFIKKPAKDSFEEHSIKVNTKFIEGIILNRLMKFDSSTRKTSQNVEKKYDSSVNVNVSEKKLKGKVKRWYVQDGKNVQLTFRQLHELQMPEIIRIAEEMNCKSFLEVGGGLLVNIDILLETYPDAEVSAIDLSFNRIIAGRENILNNHGRKIPVAKSNATSLPFPDDYFDLVFSRHALEHMPLDYKKAIDEMVRVSRKTVVLLEPSYELGALSQKLKMTASHYVKGIKKYLDSKGLELYEYHLLPIGPTFNRTAIYVLKLDAENRANNQEVTADYCPDCKRKLINNEKDNLYCEKCEALYFIHNGVPVLDTKCSVGLSNELWNKQLDS